MVLAEKQAVDQWNQIKDPDINPHTCLTLIFDSEAKMIQWKKRKHLQQMVLFLLNVSMQKNTNMPTFIILCIQAILLDFLCTVSP